MQLQRYEEKPRVMELQHITTIFITDDDEDDREFLYEALRKDRFAGSIEKLVNGEELLDSLKRNGDLNSALVVLDLNMPVLDGYDTLKAMKADQLLKNIPVIILSATSKLDDEIFCLNLGCEAFLRKPLSYDGYRIIADKILLTIANQ